MLSFLKNLIRNNINVMSIEEILYSVKAQIDFLFMDDAMAALRYSVERIRRGSAIEILK